MKYIFLFIASAFCLMGNAQGEIDTSFQLSNETGVKEIPVRVADNADDLAVVFEGEISGGSIEVELIDPSGKRQGGFELNASSDDVVSISSGSHSDRNAKGKNSNSNSNDGSGTTTTTTTSEGSTISISSGGKTTSISSGNNSVQISSGEGQGVSISSDGGVSIIKSNYSSGESQGAKGVMVESIDEPQSGRWVIRMKCEDVTGSVELVIDHD